MPRRINNQTALSLVESGKASYADGQEPKPVFDLEMAVSGLVKANESLSAALKGIEGTSGSISKKIDSEAASRASGTAEILRVCDSILENQKSLVSLISNIRPQTVNLDGISQQISEMGQFSADVPKEWTFIVDRDELGRASRIRAEEIKH